MKIFLRLIGIILLTTILVNVSLKLFNTVNPWIGIISAIGTILLFAYMAFKFGQYCIKKHNEFINQ